ncbi:Na+/H+ antiporter subunit C [bacterium]|nr:Na+/H+ antiporter subunit C [bacterium]
MEQILALIIGGLFAAGVYAILRRSIVRLVIGLVLLGQSVNLLIFAASGLKRGQPPLVAGDGTFANGVYADPLPQALILTAIVISFGVLAFTLVLLHRSYQTVGTDDLDDMKGTDT